jgi:hypothetical protein
LSYNYGHKGGYITDEDHTHMTPEQVHKASLTVVLKAKNDEERIKFLEMLGLIKENK